MKKVIIAIIVVLIIFAGIRVFTSCYENAHREEHAHTVTMKN